MTNKKRTAGLIVAFGLGLPGTVFANELLKGYPKAILCGQGDRIDIAYLGRVSEDGSAIYASLLGQRALTITSDGPAMPGGQYNPGDGCIGKTLKTLESEGRVMN